MDMIWLVRDAQGADGDKEHWPFEALLRAVHSVWSRVSFVNVRSSEIPAL